MLVACAAMLVLFLAPLAGLAWWPTIAACADHALLHRCVLSHHESSAAASTRATDGCIRLAVIRDGVGDDSVDARRCGCGAA